MTNLVAAVKRVIPRPIKDLLLLCFSRNYRHHRMLLNLLRKQNGNRVASGPFKGLEYVSKTYGSQLLPKLLGTYEKELHSTVEQICSKPYDKLVNIGAGEGYYAVGVAMQIKDASIICFERHKPSRNLLKKVARENQVFQRLHSIGNCTPSLLSEILPANNDRALVICDVEGAEIEILAPSVVPGLKNADILVELHGPAISKEIRSRFKSTHTITCIPCRPRTSQDWPDGIAMNEEYKVKCMSEYRGQSEWFWMVHQNENVPQTLGPKKSSIKLV